MTPEQSMKICLAECSLHAAVLDEGLVDALDWTPLSSGAVIEKEMLRILDQIAYRFAKLQDSMSEKLLLLVLELAEETMPTNATFAEKLNRLERIGAIPSAEEWKKFRIVRNALAHEYPEDPELRAGAINRFMAGATDLIALYRYLRDYIAAHFPRVAEYQTHIHP